MNNAEKNKVRLMIGKNIQRLRDKRGISQAELAKAIDVTTITISNYENDNRSPDFTKLKAIKEALGCSYDSLLDGDEYDAAHDQACGLSLGLSPDAIINLSIENSKRSSSSKRFTAIDAINLLLETMNYKPNKWEYDDSLLENIAYFIKLYYIYEEKIKKQFRHTTKGVLDSIYKTLLYLDNQYDFRNRRVKK